LNRFGTAWWPDGCPWNQFSSEGPSIVGTDGLFYGYFTTNRFQADRTLAPGIINILNFYLNSGNLAATRAFTCGNWCGALEVLEPIGQGQRPLRGSPASRSRPFCRIRSLHGTPS
jgi:hypothetical protein